MEFWTTLIYQKLNKVIVTSTCKRFTSTSVLSLTEAVLLSQNVTPFSDIILHVRPDEKNSSPLALQAPVAILQWQGVQILTTLIHLRSLMVAHGLVVNFESSEVKHSISLFLGMQRDTYKAFWHFHLWHKFKWFNNNSWRNQFDRDCWNKANNCKLAFIYGKWNASLTNIFKWDMNNTLQNKWVHIGLSDIIWQQLKKNYTYSSP